MIDNRNMILAVVLSVTILLGYEYISSTYFPRSLPQQPDVTAQDIARQSGTATTNGVNNAPGLPSTSSATAGTGSTSVAPAVGGVVNLGQSREEVLNASDRVLISTPRLHGSIALTGGRIDDLTLADYRETIDPDSAEIIMLSPKGSDGGYYAQFGWVAANGVKVPSPDSVWSTNSRSLSPDDPVTLTWDNGEGLSFNRQFEIDQNYMFTITQTVTNTSSNDASLHSYGLISRRGTPETTGFYILHEGLLGVFDDVLKEVDYDEIADEEGSQIKQTSVGGWIGITDKYWLTALVPDQKTKTESRFVTRRQEGTDMYQVDYLGPQLSVPAGSSIETVNRVFTGAKEVLVLDQYEEDYGVVNFDKSIDFGYFYWLTKPMFYALLWIHGNITSNLGLCILLLTVGIKALLFPLANKSYVSMSKMKKLQPEMLKLRERHGDDKTKLNQEMMALYKREKANPAAGCLPILVQIPVFFALYKVLFVTIEMRHAPFFGWIQDLSAPDPTSLFNLFGLLPYTPPDFLMIGVWPIIMGLTMFLQQKLNPQPTDPIQAKVFMFLPLMFTFMLGRFPAGLVIYWAWNNSLSIAQQWIIMHRMGLKGKQALQ